MRILMLSWEYTPHIVGGLGAHVVALVPALARAGVEVHVVTPRWAGGEPDENVVYRKTRRASPPTKVASNPGASNSRRQKPLATVYRVDPPVDLAGSFFADVQKTNVNLEEQAVLLFEEFGGFDLIHAHDWLVEFAAASLKHRFRTPLVGTIHATERGRGHGALGGDASQAIDRTEWALTYEAWRVLCTSQFMAEEVKSYFQVPSDKIDVVANGVDRAPFDALSKTDLAGFRAQWAKSDERLVFSVGRLVHEKGAHLIVEAAPRVLAELPNTRFVIAGTGPMGDLLRRRVWELGVADHVNVAGFVSDSDRDRLLKVADVAVFPSLYEPFGIVALEAMAAKCPVVVSSVGGLAEVVDPGVTGLTAYPDSIDSLAWGILETLRDPKQARARALTAYTMVKEEYNWDRIALLTEEVYERVVHERAITNW